MSSPAQLRSAPPDVPNTGLEALVDLLRGRSFAVLTGAGCSTESGIPDYRGPETRKRARNPVQYRDFIRKPVARQRYWARALVGWDKFSKSEPNAAHLALKDLETRGPLTGLITQNVDRLHTKAGSRTVVELHGALEEVICLDCGLLSPRDELQARLHEANPGWANRSAPVAPDGDVEIDQTGDFRVVDCEGCGGRLKPHVVFFGESVPQRRVQHAWRLIREAEVLLVVGSSLAVYSGFRFPRGFAEEGGQVGIINLGPTRADHLASVRVEASAGHILPHLVEALS